MSLSRCLKKMGLSAHEGAILKGAAAEYREEGMQARDAAIMAVTDYIEEALQERADALDAILKEAKKRGALADVEAALATLPQFTAKGMGIEVGEGVDNDAHEAATSPKNDTPQPTEAQKEAGNYAKGHVRLIGLDISVENPEGSTRSGTDANGKAWSVTMKSHYGYLKGTVGKDKDHIDVFVKPGTAEDWTGPVFVIDQTKGNGHFDESKVMLGFATEAEAKAAYLANYTKGWDRIRAISTTTPEEFKAWLKDGDTTQKFSATTGASVKNSAPRVTPQIPSARQLASFIGIAADSVETLRESDVERVIREAPAHFRAALAGHIAEKRPELAQEVREVRAELDEAKPEAAKPASSPEAARALKKAEDALGDLADIFGQNFRANITPEQEQKLLPVLTRLFDAAFELGYYSFRDAAKWVMQQIRGRIGDEVGDQINTEHLQGAYIGMSGKHKATGKVSPITEVGSVTKEEIDAERSSPAVEPDSGIGGAENTVGAAGVPDDGGGNDRGAREGGRGAGDEEAVVGGDREVPGTEAPAAGERGNILVSAPAESTGPAPDFPGSDEPARGSDLGGNVGALDPAANEAVDRASTGGAELQDKVGAQRAANKLPVKFNDRENVDATLPFLLEGQREDVAFAEARWAKPNGYGVLFTNGTGTGKTFLGVGVVRRFVSAGKGNGIIVVPDQTVLSAWVDSGVKLGLSIASLESTTDAGAGVTITTYANFGTNAMLADRPYDFVIMDEAHNLKVGKENEDTGYLRALRAISKHPDGDIVRATMIHRELYRKLNETGKALTTLMKMLTDDMTDARLAAHQKEIDEHAAEYEKLHAEWKVVLEAVKADVMQSQGEARTRVLFLSATPFAYDKNIDWANGYLFDYGPAETGGYNTPSPFARFMMTHFGYRMRYGKLTSPPKEVNTDLMERNFNSWLRQSGVLSSRMLDVPFDYDRKFVAVESLVGRKIDEAMEWLRTEDGGRYSFLRGILEEKFDYLSRARLLEALKANAAVDYIKKHHALGRKVIVWYDFNEGGGFNAFKFDRRPVGTTVDAQVHEGGKWTSVKVDVNDAIAKFEAKFPELVALNTNLPSPLETLTKAFPQAVQNNGITPKKKRLQNIRDFNDDARPDVNLILVQSAANAGWSGHDTTGKHMRVTINLGLPTQPHKSIQQEGRSYRVGQMSDTSHRYFNTGTTWETVAFAQKIARRAGTVENLAMGEQARGLADAFIQAFEASEVDVPGPGDGKGGKTADRALASVLSEFDRAVALYYAQEKKTARTKASEGTDYFATPEPLGLKMVQWANPREGDEFLEPSAGHGAIARWFPEQTLRVMVEESPSLAARLGLAAEGAVINGRFEDYHIVNKFSVIVMNPPFGSGGKLAVEHLAKAARHLRDGGRIVALLPTGPAADKRLDNFLHGTEERPVKPVFEHPTLGPIYKGDVAKTNASWAATGTVVSMTSDAVVLKVEGTAGTVRVATQAVTGIDPKGPRTEPVSLSEGLHMVADILLPGSTFERAGTSVSTHIVILEKQTNPALAEKIQPVTRDFSNATDINELFERIRDSAVPPRVTPAAASVDGADGTPATADQSPTIDRGDHEIVEHTTGKGKVIRGIVRRDLTYAQAKAIDAYTFKKDGGFFIREKHLSDESGSLSRSGQDETLSRSPFARRQRASEQDIAAVVAEVKRRLPGAPNVIVVKDYRDPRLPRSLAKRMADNNAEGAYHNGTVYLVAPLVSDVNYAEGLLAHENFHAALDLLEDEKDALLMDMSRGNEQLRTDAAALRAKYPGMGEIESVEEALAEYAREGREPTLMQRFVAFVRRALRAVGLRRLADGWTDGEVLALVADAPKRAFSKKRGDAVRLYTDGRLSRAGQNLASPLSSARYTEENQNAAQKILSRKSGEGILDAIVRTPIQMLRLDKVTAAVVDKTLEKLGSFASTVAPGAWEKAKAGFIDQYGLPQDVKDERAAMQGRMRAGIRSSKHAIDALGNLTRAESRVLYEYVNGDITRADLLKEGLSEESVKIIDLYQQVADEMGQEAVRLGQLDAESFDRHRWAYVHRSYQKYVIDMPEQAKVERSRALKIRGDQYKGRGMSQSVPMTAIQNVAPDWWGRKLQEGQGDKGLKGQTFVRFDRRAAVGEGVADLEGFGKLGRRGRILETHYWPAGEPVPSKYAAWDRDGEWEVRDTKGGKLIVARDFTQSERQAMGEVDEIRFAMAATLHKMIHDIEVGRMLEYLAKRYGQTADELPRDAKIATDTNRMYSLTRAYGADEWVQVPESKIRGTSAKTYGALAGLYVPGPIWNDVRQTVGGAIYPLGETYASILRAWKLSKTALSLPVHMNNVMSNVLMADFHNVGARDVVAALDVIRHRDRPENALILERFEDAGAAEGLYSLTELQKQTIQPLLDQLRAEVEAIDPAQGIARASSIVSLITQMRYREAFTLASQSKAGKGAGWLRDKMTKAYEDEDLVFRLAAFIREKGNGATDMAAGRHARESFLDYQINAPWIQLMRQTAFPFFSFVYRAAPMMLDVAKNRPWKIVKWGGIFGLLNMMGYLGSGGDEDKERKLLPEELAGRTILGSPKTLRLPWNDANGSPVMLDVRRWIPVGDLVDWGQTHSVVPFFPQLMPSGPAGLMFELALNKSQFTGKEITLGTDTAGEMTAKLADYLYKSFAPNTPGVPFGYSTEKIMQAGGGKTDVFGREQSVAQAVASGMGVKVGSYPADVLQRNAVMKYNAEDAEIKAGIGRLQRELQRKGIDPATFEERVARQGDKRRELAGELAKKLGQQ